MPIWISAGIGSSHAETTDASSVYTETICHDMSEGMEYGDGTKRGTKEVWSFSKHQFYIFGYGIDFGDETLKTLNWELKNITKDVMIDSGTWQYKETGKTAFYKIVETTNDYRGDTVRITLTVTQTAKKLFVCDLSSTLFI